MISVVWSCGSDLYLHCGSERGSIKRLISPLGVYMRARLTVPLGKGNLEELLIAWGTIQRSVALASTQCGVVAIQGGLGHICGLCFLSLCVFLYWGFLGVISQSSTSNIFNITGGATIDESRLRKIL